MDPELNAVITGASSAIGGTTAIASTGAAVCLVARNAERLETVARNVRGTARSVQVISSDLTIDCAVQDLARLLESEFKPPDVLVHCAGAFTHGNDRGDGHRAARRLVPAQCALAVRLDPTPAAFVEIAAGADRLHQPIARIGSESQRWPLRRNPTCADGPRRQLAPGSERRWHSRVERVSRAHGDARMKSLYEAEGRDCQAELLLQAEDIAQAVMASLQMPRTAEITNVEIRPLIKSY
jgi:hypothetical protein